MEQNLKKEKVISKARQINNIKIKLKKEKEESEKVEKEKKNLIGGNIPVQINKYNAMVNATLLCKESGKNLNDYFSLESTKLFLANLELPLEEIQMFDMFRSIAWVHKAVAYNLSQWISGKFNALICEWFIQVERDACVFYNENLKLIEDNNSLTIELKNINTELENTLKLFDCNSYAEKIKFKIKPLVYKKIKINVNKSTIRGSYQSHGINQVNSGWKFKRTRNVGS